MDSETFGQRLTEIVPMSVEKKFMIAIIVWQINRNIIVYLMSPQNYLTNMKNILVLLFSDEISLPDSIFINSRVEATTKNSSKQARDKKRCHMYETRSTFQPLCKASPTQ